MQIDITKLLTNYVSTLNIESNVTIPENLINDVRLKSLDNVFLKGKVSLDEDDNILITGKLSGNMILIDDLTLESFPYQFETYIEENLENYSNTLDITDILWQNILVEIPSKVRKTNEDINLSGDGWRVISEDKFNEERNKQDNPFGALNELLETKEDR